MIHCTTYTDNTAFIEVKNCNDDSGKPVIYAKQFEDAEQMRATAIELQNTLNAGIVWKTEKTDSSLSE